MRHLALWVVVLIGVVLFYGLADPASGIFPRCPFHALTAMYCPGCGSQRALHALLNGELMHAITLNPLLVLSMGFFGVEGGIWLLQHKGSNVRTLSSRRYTPWIVFGVVAVFWVLRNIPAEPFTVLAP
jgi:hypothetical protein